MEGKNTILFVCTGNSCRSQMAEGFMKELLSTGHIILSAGLKPSTVNPVAIKAMSEKTLIFLVKLQIMSMNFYIISMTMLLLFVIMPKKYVHQD